MSGSSEDQERSADPKGGWSEDVLSDYTLEAFMRRLDRLQQILIDRGKFSRDEVTRALVSSRADTKEGVARWLRTQLQELRHAKTVRGAAPVLNAKALPRSLMADLSMTMLECLDEAPGENLTSLFRELLDVDRHRKNNADETANHEKFEHAVSIAAQARLRGFKPHGVRDLSKELKVSTSVASGWLKSAEYEVKVEQSLESWKRHFAKEFEQAKAVHPDFSETQLYRLLFQALVDELGKKHRLKAMKDNRTK